MPDDGLAWWIHCVVGWDVAALVLLSLAWNIILRAGGEETERSPRLRPKDRERHTGHAL